jgi:hypothetical protein
MALRRLLLRVIACGAGAVTISLPWSGCGRATAPDPGPIRASSLSFSLQPEYGTAGQPIGPGIAVTVRNNNGDTAFSSSATIRLAIMIGTGPVGAHLGGTTEVAAVNGTATFFDVTIDSAAVGYRLLASAPGLGGAASDSFDITAGPPVKLAFAGQPGMTLAGDTITPPVRIAVQDSLGNTVLTAADPITVAIASNPGPGVLIGTSVRQAAAGVAVFPDLRIGEVGAGYTLQASASGLASALSAPFAIVVSLRRSLALRRSQPRP